MRADQEAKVADNVISLFAAKAKAEQQSASEDAAVAKEAVDEHDFAEEVRRNQQAAERMKKERQKANRSVLRSYRLKT